jgi:hypothetical protein
VDITTKIDFDFEYASKNFKKIFKDFADENLDDVEEQLKSNITNFRGKDISDANRDVRIMRGRASFKPLIDTGRLLNSIKKTKAGVSFKKYGVYVDEGFKFKRGWNKGKDGFYSPSNKRGIRKKIINVAGKTVPARPWIYYTPGKKAYDLFYEKLFTSIKTVERTITKRTVRL